ncbi:helix-turn-helix domain-containing protein [Anaerobacillus isosaccharinicus]|uniref:Helix-turn-helix transcriptional regulator n=1 Tax=Anaerobacillus isosaccharinicus TaxID=1532552 RepID=A0A1S2KXI2_9BACI|nr:helix-turn-helix transcriptional regulator [Anaerobacillus isosaccharinicus]MBA5586891.1 helix-turn-helix transcriptional regulator [Anaerobacillus isosaccharinicus]QOY34900.1 helix-turn-helix transcriptional regulator [Anaerobacillus isosaccharinicus]
MKHIGEKIKDLRLKHGMTLKELGDAIEFNYSNLSKIERGHRKPAIEFLQRLAHYFKVEMSYFFNGQKYLQDEENIEEYQLIDLIEEMKRKNISYEELLEMIRKLDDMKNQVE